MRILSSLVMAGLSTVLAGASAAAQGRPLPAQTPPARTQQGSAGPVAPPASQGRADDRGGREEYRRYDRYGRSYTYIPAVVTADGRVYSNFGYGYEQVAQQCSGVQPAGGTPQTTAVPGSPVPANQRAEQVPGFGTAPVMHAGMPSTPATNACWMRLANGAVVVRR